MITIPFFICLIICLIGDSTTFFVAAKKLKNHKKTLKSSESETPTLKGSSGAGSSDSGSESGKWYMNVSIVGDNGLAKKKDCLEKTLAKKQKSLENLLDNKKQSPEKISIGFNAGQHDLKKPSPETH